MRLSYKYRIYPNKEQEEVLNKNFSFCCFLYNCALQERNSYYKRYGKGISYNHQASELKEIKEEFKDQTKYIYSQTLQQVLKRLDTSYQNFFRRVKQKAREAGFPRYKSGDRFNSIVFPQSNLQGFGVKLSKNNNLNIFGIPGEVLVDWHRPFQGRCKQVILKRQSNKFYVIISCDDVPLNLLPKTGNTIAIDLGLNNFITSDDGTQFHHPKPYKTSKEKLAYLNRKLDAKQRASKNRIKAKKQLNKCYEKISNIRNDFLHKLSNQIVKENDTIIIEKLNVKSMLEKPKASPTIDKDGNKVFKPQPKKDNIQDASWARFASFLIYKAERAGRIIIEVDPRNTSKTCSNCNNIDNEQTLADRQYNCKACGFAIDRDHNAALNIKRLGISLVSKLDVQASAEAPKL
jgi:putative transposase